MRAEQAEEFKRYDGLYRDVVKFRFYSAYRLNLHALIGIRRNIDDDVRSFGSLAEILSTTNPTCSLPTPVSVVYAAQPFSVNVLASAFKSAFSASCPLAFSRCPFVVFL